MRLLTTSEAGKVLRLSPSSVRNLCDQRKLKVIRHTPNGRRLIVEDSIYSYLETITEAPVESLKIHEPQFTDPTELTQLIGRLKRAK